MATIRDTIAFIVNHPLNRGHELGALWRFVAWQIGTRLVPGPVVVPFVDNARLLVRRGVTRATGSVFTGLHELGQMAFVLHLLRPDDVLLDVGANVGSYTILGGAEVGCRCLSFEPVASTYRELLGNARLNDVGDRVTCINAALGSSPGHVRISTGLGPMNQVVLDRDSGVIVPVQTRDYQPVGDSRCVVKMDVEGDETEVVAGGHKLLSNPRTLAVVMELGRSGAGYGFDASALHVRRTDWGYTPMKCDPISRALSRGRIDSHNTFIHVRDDRLVRQRLATARRSTARRDRVHGREYS